MTTATSTTRSAVAGFPDESVTEYTTTYDPPAPKLRAEASTVIEAVRSPSAVSEAVAPGSVKTSPTVSCIGLAPNNDNTGGVVSATSTVRVTVAAALPAESATS